ncbi:restriction endonuclease subunit S [Pseudorhodoferax sp.]|uniref:restriction endonuclease subunit S n=1 Tax=Pseudorhodoferax sp. TaxID=1993553 RepID=UPI0039E247C1
MSWPKLPLDQLGYVSRGRSRHRPRNDPLLYGGQYPFIQTGDVKHASFRIYQHSATYSEAGLAQSRLWPKDTLCITIAANIADTALLAYEACFPDSVIGFVADRDKADPRFVKYYFNIIQRELQMVSQGATQDNLSQEKLLSFGIACPPVEVQRQVAEVLATYDDLIATNQRRIALLEQAARLLYREWFVHLRFPGHESVPVKFGEPEGWRMVSIADQASYLNRGIAPKYDDTAKGWVINQKCIRDGRITMVPARRQSKDVKPDRLVRMGDVLINSTGAGTLGRVAQVWSPIKDCTVDTHVTIVRPIDINSSTYFGQALLNLEPLFAEMGKGATNQLELSRSDIGDIKIWQPPEHVRVEFHRMVGPMLEQAEQLSIAIQLLQRARDLLLPKLMSGQLDVSGIAQPEAEEVAA